MRGPGRVGPDGFLLAALSRGNGNRGSNHVEETDSSLLGTINYYWPWYEGTIFCVIVLVTWLSSAITAATRAIEKGASLSWGLNFSRLMNYLRRHCQMLGCAFILLDLFKLGHLGPVSGHRDPHRDIPLSFRVPPLGWKPPIKHALQIFAAFNMFYLFGFKSPSTTNHYTIINPQHQSIQAMECHPLSWRTALFFSSLERPKRGLLDSKKHQDLQEFKQV